MIDMSLTPSELLHAYVDGELDAAMEASLFSALNHNMDLRTEMRELLALRNAVKKDRTLLVPPVSATAAVFGSLGMTAPYVINSGGWFSSLWSRIWIPLFVGVVSTALTWFGLSSPNHHSIPSAEGQQTSAKKQEQPNNTQGTLGSPVPSTQKQQHEYTSTIKYIKVPVEKIVYKDKVVYKDRIVYRSKFIVNSNADTKRNSSIVPEVIEDKDNVYPIQVPINVSEVQAASVATRPFFVPSSISIVPAEQGIVSEHMTTELQTTIPQESLRWRSQIRGLSGNSLVSVNKHPEGGIGFNNMAIGLLYQVAENHYVGMEAGAEPFALSMKGTYNSLAATYELHPSLFTFSAVYQGRFDAGSLVFPFAQLSVGGTEYGPLAKGIFGIQYMPIPHLGLIGGFEYSQLWYRFQSLSFSTPKIGFTYGLSYQF